MPVIFYAFQSCQGYNLLHTTQPYQITPLVGPITIILYRLWAYHSRNIIPQVVWELYYITPSWGLMPVIFYAFQRRQGYIL